MSPTQSHKKQFSAEARAPFGTSPRPHHLGVLNFALLTRKIWPNFPTVNKHILGSSYVPGFLWALWELQGISQRPFVPVAYWGRHETQHMARYYLSGTMQMTTERCGNKWYLSLEGPHTSFAAPYDTLLKIAAANNLIQSCCKRLPGPHFLGLASHLLWLYLPLTTVLSCSVSLTSDLDFLP